MGRFRTRGIGPHGGGCSERTGFENEDGVTAECLSCDAIVPFIRFSTPENGWATTDRSVGVVHGRNFTSARDLDAYAAEQGATAVSTESAEFRQHKFESQTRATEQYQKLGYRDAYHHKHRNRQDDAERASAAKAAQGDAPQSTPGQVGRMVTK